MTRALAVEWLRVRSRRLVWLLAGLALAGVVAVLVGTTINAAPPSAAERASAQAQVDMQLADPSFQESLRQCRAAVAAGGSADWPADMNCDDMLPKTEWFLGWQPPAYLELLSTNVFGVSLLLAAAFMVIGVVFAGSDWAAGTMGTQLLFQPRRGQVFASKAIVLGLVASVFAVIGISVAWVLSYWVAARWGTTSMLQPTGYRGDPRLVTGADLVVRVLRGVALVVAATLGGYSLAMLFRGSALPLALVAAYALVGETIARAFGFEATWPYLLSTRLLAWMQGPIELPVYPPACERGPCEPRIISVSITDGGIYLAVLTAVGVALALWSFRRRDVN